MKWTTTWPTKPGWYWYMYLTLRGKLTKPRPSLVTKNSLDNPHQKRFVKEHTPRSTTWWSNEPIPEPMGVERGHDQTSIDKSYVLATEFQKKSQA